MLGEVTDTIKNFATVSAVVGALYAFFTHSASRARHHIWLTNLLERLTKRTFLDYLRNGVWQALNIVSAIYGPPSTLAHTWMGKYFTLNAWRVSAWISSIYIFVVAPLVALVLLHWPTPQYEQSLANVAYIAAAPLILASIVLVQLKMFRSVRDGGKNKREVKFISKITTLMGDTTFGLLVIFSLIIIHTKFGDSMKSHTVIEIIFRTCVAIIVLTLTVAWVLRNISVFNFYAPLMMIAEILTAPFIALGTALAIAIVWTLVLVGGSALKSYWAPKDKRPPPFLFAALQASYSFI